MEEIDKRPRYFDGQLLKEEDFNLALNYVIERARSHGKLFHSPGIADGLTVEVGSSGDKVTVASGIAIDQSGCLIVLGKSYTLSLSEKPFAGKTVLVVISYFEEESDQASVGAKGFTRWHELPKVEVVLDGSAAYPEATHLRLARLEIDAKTGKVSKHDTSVRRLAGARLGAQADVPKLRLSREGLPESSWPALTCGAADRVDLASDLKVLRDLQVGRILTIGPGKTTTDAEFSLSFTGHESDTARIWTRTTDGATSLNITVGDDGNDELNISTLGWRAGQRGPLSLAGGNIKLEIEAGGRALSVVDSAAKPLLLVRGDGRVGIGTTDPKATLEVNSGAADASPILAVTTPNGEDFFSIYGARKSAQTNDLLWKRGPLRFGTATSFGAQAFSEKMRITETGNVGINAPDPGTYRLVVRQEVSNTGRGLRILNADSSKSLQLWVGPVGGVLDAEDTANLHLRTANQDRLFIQNGGNVGVGTTNPLAKLEVGGDLRLDNGASDGARLIWAAKDKREWRARNNTNLDFFQEEGTPPVLTLAPGGRVGIGVQLPNEALEVADNVRIHGALMVLREPDEDEEDAGILILGSGSNFWRITQRSAMKDRLMIFRQDPHELPKGPYLTITTDGKVGIGTDNPAATLHVGGNAQIDGALGIGTSSPREKLHIAGNVVLDNGAPDGARLIWAAKDKAEWRVRNSGTLDFFQFQQKDQKEGAPVLTLTSGGNVGVGTGSPADKLHVAGNIRLDGTLTVSEGIVLGRDLQVGRTLTIGPGKTAADAEFSLSFTAHESDTARIWTQMTGGATTLNITVGDDVNDQIKISTSGWQAGQRGPLYLAGGNITLEIEAGGRALSVVDSAAKPLLLVRGDGRVGIGTQNPLANLHVVGTSILQQEAWKPVTFRPKSDWDNYIEIGPTRNDYNSAAYLKNSQGFVQLRGMVTGGTGTIFTLPEGYRPARRELFGVINSSPSLGRLDVLADGQVVMISGNNGWISLDGLIFQAAIPGSSGGATTGTGTSGGTNIIF